MQETWREIKEWYAMRIKKSSEIKAETWKSNKSCLDRSVKEEIELWHSIVSKIVWIKHILRYATGNSRIITFKLYFFLVFDKNILSQQLFAISVL